MVTDQKKENFPFFIRTIRVYLVISNVINCIYSVFALKQTYHYCTFCLGQNGPRKIYYDYYDYNATLRFFLVTVINIIELTVQFMYYGGDVLILLSSCRSAVRISCCRSIFIGSVVRIFLLRALLRSFMSSSSCLSNRVVRSKQSHLNFFRSSNVCSSIS